MMRNAAATGLLLVAAFGATALRYVPAVALPTLATPSKEMQQAVKNIANALRGFNAVDRMLWSQIWSKVAVAVDADNTDTQVVWGDTEKLKVFTSTALRIGWRRIGGNKPGKYPELQTAVEAAFAAILTTKVQPVTKELRQSYCDLCQAIAWAGIGRDQ